MYSSFASQSKYIRSHTSCHQLEPDPENGILRHYC